MKLIFVAYIFAVADPGLIKENFPSKVVSEEVFDAHWSIVALNIEYDFRTLEEDIPDMLSDRTAKRTLDPTVNQWLSQLGFKLVESF